MVLCKK